MGKLTKRAIEAAVPGPADYFLWDGELPSFGIRILPSGRKSFVLQYRIGRRSRRYTLGLFGVLSVDAARSLAIHALSDIRSGGDPAERRSDDRKATTVRELASRFDVEHIQVHLKPSTAAEYRRNLRRFILPALGNLRVGEVTRAHIARFHGDCSDRPYQANRNLEIISKMFNLAEMWGLRPDGSNPRRHLKKYPEKKRERFLSAGELRRVGEVLGEMAAEQIEMPSAITATRLLMLTGCRLSEIMTLKWAWVDLIAGVLNLPDSKTGKKVVPLGEAAIKILVATPRQSSNGYVIAGRKHGNCLTDLQPFWQRVRARAGLKDVRIHDLRHTFASVAVSEGKSLPMIGKLLGHTQVQTTARYAHLATGTVRRAADQVSASIAEAMSSAATGFSPRPSASASSHLAQDWIALCS